ncbi:MAG: oligosaccharide flippase family protein [Filimonas sp.]|nr:oligosaccharide flippase family protein [Filimonas sp.]
MRSRLIRNISANIVQQAVNQVFSLAIFYILSRQLSKESFGAFNWSLAFLFTAFNILSFGLDQLTVKKIASGQETSPVTSLHLLHVLLTGTLFYGLLAICCQLLQTQPATTFLLALGAGKLLSYFASPFKQAIAGKEAFSAYAWMSAISNIVKGSALIIAGTIHIISIPQLVAIFIAGDAAELAISVLIYFGKKNGIQLTAGFSAYFGLLAEALPQLGVVISTTLMSRFDWLLIGIIASATQLAEYSFAYKVFEVATFPLLVVAPLLIPRFVKYAKGNHSITEGILAIMRAEMFIAAFIILLLNICWAPLMDTVTAGKYGAVNNHTIFILSLSMPFLYANNILWTDSFAQGKLHSIFRIIGLTCLVNVAGDCLLIPFLRNEGAAIAYAISQLIQLILYTRENKAIKTKQVIYTVAGSPLCAVFSLLVVKWLALSLIPALLIGFSLYFLLIAVNGLLVKKDIRQSVHLLSPDTQLVA